MGKQDTYVIVGGVGGGATAAARLRRLDEFAKIVIFEKGSDISFANCGLPYYVGGDIAQKSTLSVMTPESFAARYNVEVRVDSRVVSIDRVMKTVTVKDVNTGETFKQDYTKLVLSPGAAPIMPEPTNGGVERMFTMRTIPDAEQVKTFVDEFRPQTAVVIGGGFVGIEMAESLALHDVQVTMVEMSDQVLPTIDFDMAGSVHRYLEKKGIALLLGKRVTDVNEKAGGLEVVMEEETIPADLVINAIGVRPESGLAKIAGLQVDKLGRIMVDGSMRTSDEDIYAVGDAVQVRDFVTGMQANVPLAGPANKQARIAADNICGIKSIYGGAQGSAIVRLFDMTVASTGINEKTAKKLEIDYEKSFVYPQSHAGYYPGATNMFIKTIFERKTGKILGAQIVGRDGVDKRMDVYAMAIRMSASAKDLTQVDLCYAPQFSAPKDPVNTAAYVIEDILAGNYMEYHWHDVARLPRDGSVQLIDVRTPMEYATEHIEGYANIPLDELRRRLGELDKRKKTYVMCHSGTRGYAACRILMQVGFQVYNLSGGYALYKSIFGAGVPQEAAKTLDETTEIPVVKPIVETKPELPIVDTSGLQSPGPVMKLGEALRDAPIGEMFTVVATDPAFEADIQAYARATGLEIQEIEKEQGTTRAVVRKGVQSPATDETPNGKTLVVFSDDLDRAIASFVIANTAVAMGRPVTMFFTFWGLAILRRSRNIEVEKTPLGRAFARMLPRGSTKLKLSKKGSTGADMVRRAMQDRDMDSLEQLMRKAIDSGVEIVACSMSMEIMGIQPEELIDGVKVAGTSTMLASAEDSDTSLFI